MFLPRFTAFREQGPGSGPFLVALVGVGAGST